MKQMGRLALREEGLMWNAYYALPDTMKDAVYLGSIAMVAVRDNKDHKQRFMDLMKSVVSDIIREKIGVAPEWPHPPQSAPESERSGSA